MKFTPTMTRIAMQGLRVPLQERGVDPDSSNGQALMMNSITACEKRGYGFSSSTLLKMFAIACEELDAATWKPHPLRVQRKRTKGFRLPPKSVCMTRGTIYGNPFQTAKEFEEWLLHDKVNPTQLIRQECLFSLPLRRQKILSTIHEHRGRYLACFCPLTQPCHVDILAQLANS